MVLFWLIKAGNSAKTRFQEWKMLESGEKHYLVEITGWLGL